jgi:hypothetical protein
VPPAATKAEIKSKTIRITRCIPDPYIEGYNNQYTPRCCLVPSPWAMIGKDSAILWDFH